MRVASVETFIVTIPRDTPYLGPLAPGESVNSRGYVVRKGNGTIYPTVDRSIVVKGRIAHCHIGQLTDVVALYRTGVEFVELTEHARNAIGHFVAATKVSQGPPSIVDGIIAED